MQQFSSLLSWRLFTAQHVSGVFPPIIRSSMTAVAASGFTFVSWWQSCCVRGRASQPAGWPARPRTQHDCHHDTKVKPEVATAVIELLLMRGKTPETCWAANKRQDNKLENCCIRLVIYLKNKLPLRKHDSAQNQYWITKMKKSYSNIIIYFKHSKDKILEKVKPSRGQAQKKNWNQYFTTKPSEYKHLIISEVVL